MVDYLRYDVEANPDHPWLRSADASGQDISMELISQETIASIRARYTLMELDMKAILEYSCLFLSVDCECILNRLVLRFFQENFTAVPIDGCFRL